MVLKKKIGSKQDVEIKGTKSLYESPRLIRFGLVKDWTTSGTAVKNENSGNDTGNNARRNRN